MNKFNFVTTLEFFFIKPIRDVALRPYHCPPEKVWTAVRDIIKERNGFKL